MPSVKTVKHINIETGDLYVTGSCNIGQKLHSYSANVQKAVADALRLAGGELQTKSADITPVKTGELKSRVFTSDVIASKDGQTIVVGYEKYGQSYPMMPEGSPNMYSVYVHENRDAHHTGRGQAKFLETAAEQFETDYLKALRVTLKEARP